ncbi:MAG: type II secretion system protein [Clostridia bacterium]|jgi:prepilin-type N-terminal cleavage/methylation domain-containing protein|nr:type II secretion system protein [Clostridia bacterium]
MTLKKNNKGFSLVEMIVVITIMGIAVSLVVGSMVSVYRARSKKAAETLDAVISQCKIDSMSGLDCYLTVSLEDGDYYAKLHRTGAEVYKTEKLASDNMTMSAGTNSLAEEGSELYLKFDRATGAVTDALYKAGEGASGADLYDGTSVFEITMSSTGTHTITIYKNSGEHVLDA